MRWFGVIFITLLTMTMSLDAAHRKLLITGCGRAGTTFIATLLQKSGYAIGHECMADGGIVSWSMCVNRVGCGVIDICEDTFEHVFHQVRHPLDVMTSWYTNWPDTNIELWKIVRGYLPEIDPSDSPIVHCAKYWYYWNLLAEEKAEWRYQLEQIGWRLPEFTSRSGLKIDFQTFQQISTKTNRYAHIGKRLRWIDLQRELPPDLFLKIQLKAIEYGYYPS